MAYSVFHDGRIYLFDRVDQGVLSLDTLIFEEMTPLDIWLSKPGLCVLHVYSGVKLVAFLAFYEADETTLHIWKTAVHPDYQEKGIFKKMLSMTHDRANKEGKDVTIGTKPSRFPVMHAFLERSTCVPYERQPPKEGYVYYRWHFAPPTGSPAHLVGLF